MRNEDIQQLKLEFRLLERLVNLLNKWGAKCQKRTQRKRYIR